LLTASVFVRRGITAYNELQFYLEDDIRYAHNPFHFAEIEDVINRIRQAREEGEKVLVYGDRDVDGITATVLMVEELEELGIDVTWSLPTGDEPYGLSQEVIDTYYQESATLIITVDCGISNHREIEYARSLGIDTIVIDHHNPKEEIPQARAIINPKMEDEPYPFRDLAGCMVAAKVIWGLRFAETELYNTPVCLLNVRPANETYVLEAVKLVNLVEVDRIYENLVPGVVELDKTRLEQFFSYQIYVYDADMQTRMLKQVFGEDIMINLFDLAPEIWKHSPGLEGKSLLQMTELSRMALYKDESLGELDVLINMFNSLFINRNPSLGEGYVRKLDLVALGTLADMMPLINENRILVRNGLDIINNSPRKGLRELLQKQNLMSKTLGTHDIAWQITPLINATGRMGEPDKAVELFLSDDDAERVELVETIVGLNKKRRKLGDSAWNRIFPAAQKSYEELGGRLVFVADSDLHRGVTGIIASRLMKYFRTTAIAVSLMGDMVFGSVRSVKEFDVKGFLEQCSHFFLDYGGHDFAAGFNMESAQFEEFQEKVKQLITGMEPAPVEKEQIEIDAELPLSYLSPELIHLVERFEPYGEGNAPLLFLCRKVRIANADIVGKSEKQHLKLLVDTGKQKWPAILWNGSDRLGKDFEIKDQVDIVFRLGKNYYLNTETLQLTILDMKK
jgi:single-stranded-DNA-specific exonuclease